MRVLGHLFDLRGLARESYKVVDEDPDYYAAIGRSDQSAEKQIPNRIRIPQVVLNIKPALSLIN